MGEYFQQEIKEKYNIQINISSTPADNAITQNVTLASDWFHMKLMMNKDSIATIPLSIAMKHHKTVA